MPMGECPTSRTWTARAACTGAPTAWWFPDDTTPPGHVRDAKRVCRTCPVLVECVVSAIVEGWQYGIRGGAGGAWRRRLTRAHATATHDPLATCHDPACDWCTALTEHRSALARLNPDRDERPVELHPVDSNGPGARHGRRSTYARGHRCPPCRLSMSTAGAALDAASLDVATWWDTEWSPLAPTADWADIAGADAVLPAAKRAARSHSAQVAA